MKNHIKPCWLVHSILLIPLILVVRKAACLDCTPGIQSDVATLPGGDITIEYGNPLEILCVLDSTHTKTNASSLAFYNGSEIVPKQFINIVNETTIRLFIEKPPLTNNFFYCELTNGNEYKNSCFNYVSVRAKPLPARNFHCISYNWESLNCSWVNNMHFSHTTYRISLSEHRKSRNIYQCPDNSDILHNYCVWTAITTPPYPQLDAKYYVTLNGSNEISSLSTMIEINHFGIVVPKEPENLYLREATPFSLEIAWTVPLAMQNFPVKIDSKVRFRLSADPLLNWTDANTSSIIEYRGDRILNITSLNASTSYDIQVQIKSSMAVDLPKFWSKEASLKDTKTKPTVPKMPPETVIGNFESFPRANDPSLRNIYVYWKRIPKGYENGEGFGYNITVIEIVDGHEKERHVKPTIYEYYAFFENLSYNTYIFKVVSFNKEGVSADHSTIVVPAGVRTIDYPLTLNKHDYGNGLYELSWSIPTSISANNLIENYTIFWYTNMFETFGGSLNWTVLSGNMISKNVSLSGNQTYQFAISANHINSSSGMIWAEEECIVQEQVQRQRIGSIWEIKTDSTYVQLGWNLNCTYFEVKDFVLEYCTFRSTENPQCDTESTKAKRFTDYLNSSGYNITNLMPFSNYLINLFLVYTNDSLISRNTLKIKTLEAAPDDPPTNLKVRQVTNTSVTISWSPPTKLNGNLKNYSIDWNSNHTVIVNNSSIVLHTLKDLSSYEYYNINVSACTIACSLPARLEPPVRTNIGIPGILNAPVVSYRNRTHLKIAWDPLKSGRGGENDYYDIKVQVFNEQKTPITQHNLRFNSTHNMNFMESKMEMLIEGCQELNSTTYFTVQVRAVNVDRQTNYNFEGPWSPSYEGICPGNSHSLHVILLFSVLGITSSFLVIAIAVNCIRCIWKHCEKQSDFKIMLPPELELAIKRHEADLKSLPPAANFFENDQILEVNQNIHSDSCNTQRNIEHGLIDLFGSNMNATTGIINSPSVKENVHSQLFDCGSENISDELETIDDKTFQSTEICADNPIFVLHPGAEGYKILGKINLEPSNRENCNGIESNKVQSSSELGEGSYLPFGTHAIDEAGWRGDTENKKREDMGVVSYEKCKDSPTPPYSRLHFHCYGTEFKQPKKHHISNSDKKGRHIKQRLVRWGHKFNSGFKRKCCHDKNQTSSSPRACTEVSHNKPNQLGVYNIPKIEECYEQPSHIAEGNVLRNNSSSGEREYIKHSEHGNHLSCITNGKENRPSKTATRVPGIQMRLNSQIMDHDKQSGHKNILAEGNTLITNVADNTPEEEERIKHSAHERNLASTTDDIYNNDSTMVAGEARIHVKSTSNSVNENFKPYVHNGHISSNTETINNMESDVVIDESCNNIIKKSPKMKGYVTHNQISLSSFS